MSNSYRIYKTLYFILQRLRKEPVKAAIKDMENTLFSDLNQLKEIQYNRLKVCLIHAIEHVPYYKRSLSDFKNEIYALSNWDDANSLMQKLPVLSKKEFNKNRSLFFSDDINKRKYYLNKTSGSSGNPIIFPCDQESWAYRHAAIFRSLKIFNIDIGEPYGYFFGQHWKGNIKTKTKDFIFNRVRVSAFNLNLQNTERYFEKLKRKKVTYFIGYPNSIVEFLLNCEYMGLNMNELPLKLIVTTGEVLSDQNKEVIERIAKVPCANQYGSAEGGSGAFSGVEGFLHWSMETTWLNIDSDGEIYKTDLFLRSCPLINFRIGDKTEGILDVSKNLQQKQFVIKNVIGRSQDDIVLANGKRINSHIPNYIFKNINPDWGVIKFRFYFQKNSNSILLYVQCLKALNKHETEELIQSSRKFMGEDINISIVETADFPLLPNAKHRIMLLVDSLDKMTD